MEWTDQRIRRLDADGEPVALTPEPSVARGDRYADGDVSPDGTWMVVVREHHPSEHAPATEVRNEIVRLDARAPSEPEVLVTGPDFVAAPRISPDGRRWPGCPGTTRRCRGTTSCSPSAGSTRASRPSSRAGRGSR